MKTPRWSARVAEGLSSIAAYVECELQAHEASCLACSCDVCCYRIPDPVYEGQFIGLRDDMECLCEAKSYSLP
ncbi:hypothetical protein KW797_04800, partial [Candidatus Parcubacteria bacterium]|nr:hypothetical protein [Candidatus Parcubacteria bacterium]